MEINVQQIEDEETDIVIVGGGICGLAVALALHRKGIRSVVLERCETLRATGAAIIMQPNGWRALDQLGVAYKLRPTAISLLSAHFIKIQSGKKESIPLGIGEMRCLKRTDLIESLADDLPAQTIRLKSHVVSVQLDPITSYPILQLHDGNVLKAKVVIGCDGVNSIIANNILGLNATNTLSLSIVRGFTNYENGHGFDSEFIVISNDGVTIGRLPVTDKQVYWFLTRKWTCQDTMIVKDSNLIKDSTVQTVEGFPKEVVEMIANSELEMLHLSDMVKYRAPWDLMVGRSLRKGTVTVAGDAMHAMGPFIAQGGSASLEDAVVLGRCLAQNLCNNGNYSERSTKKVKLLVEHALDQYIKERRWRVFKLALQTLLIGMIGDTSSMLVKALCIAILVIFFRDSIAHTDYDCGHL